MMSEDFVRGLMWVKVLVEAMRAHPKRPATYQDALTEIIVAIDAQMDDMAKYKHEIIQQMNEVRPTQRRKSDERRR